MNKQELNKRRAEWAGFKIDSSLGHSGASVDPSGKHIYETPNFPKSLDACIKWLVPKLDGYRLNYQAEWPDITVAVVRTVNRYFEGSAKTPALALCLAIDKLIEGEL